jgi:signal transduction histidine kinase
MSSGVSRREAVVTAVTTATAWVAAVARAAVATGATDPPSPTPAWRQRLQFGPVDLVFLADVVLALILWGATDSWLNTQNGRHHHAFGSETLLLFAFVLAAPLVLRTRFPATAWAASAVSLVWVSVEIGQDTLFTGVYPAAGVLVYGLCLYAVGVRGKGWFVLCVATVTLLGALVVDARSSVGAILAAIPLLMGAIVRARRSSRTELAQQARRLEGERALLTERQRIARELHDIVAHHMSVIAIQAEAGPRKVANPPPELVESFADIRASALSGLDELRRLLGVMRSSGADTAPQPGLAELDDLLDSARSGGVRVTSSVSGTARVLPQGIDLSAYRIVQEALSNVMRHAPGSAARVELGYAPSALVIKVRNDACAAQNGDADQEGAGHGLIGMRERAGMLGGHLEAGPTDDGGFLVTAVLPDTGDREAGRP